MFVSRVSRFGTQMVKHLTKGTLTSAPKTGNLPKVFNYFFHSLKHQTFSTTTAHEKGDKVVEEISVTFVDKDEMETHIKVPIGMSMLEAAHEHDIELEGACEGSCACSTCHVIVRVCTLKPAYRRRNMIARQQSLDTRKLMQIELFSV
ncbi:unnamed protein product [Prunus armeniaca]